MKEYLKKISLVLATCTFLFSCDKFLEENIMPDYYIGVSAGMAYGLSYLSGQKGRNLELMENIWRISAIWVCAIC